MVVVLTPEVAVLAPTFTPVNFTLPIKLVPLPTKSVLKSVFKILRSWSFNDFSVGLNNKLLVPPPEISVSIFPKSKVVKSFVFSNKIASSSSVKTTTSVIWVSSVSGSIICIK